MKTVIKLLRKELKAWKQQYERLAQHSLEDCRLHIAELEAAISKIISINGSAC